MSVESEGEFAAEWAGALGDMAAQDSASVPPSNTILFTGSSSIAFWNTLSQDMAPLTVINRGLAGSTMQEILRWLDLLVLKYAPRAIVLYGGDNDIGYFGRTPEVFLEHTKNFVARVRTALPSVRIYLLTIKPSVVRWDVWPSFCFANDLLKACSETDASLHLVDIAPCMLDEHGRPRTDLFEADGLHLSAKGYEEWTSVLRPVLLAREAIHEPSGSAGRLR